jgi:hypothetical protein
LYHVDGGLHPLRKVGRFVGGGEVESVHLTVRAPLVETRRRLVVNQTANDAAIHSHSSTLNFTTDDTKRLIFQRLVYVYVAGSVTGAWRPFLVFLFVYHDVGAHLANRIFAHFSFLLLSPFVKIFAFF